MNIVLLDSSDWKEVGTKGISREELQRHLQVVIGEVTNILELPEHCSVAVRPHEWLDIVPEIGVGGKTIDTELVTLTFDPKLPYGKDKLFESLRETLFHEMNHVYRWMDTPFDDYIVNSVIFEGLATVFETDYAEAEPLYGQYDETVVEKWLDELVVTGMSSHNDYFFDHPDDRKWIGYKVGTWLVREAMKNSGKNVVELTRMPWRDILDMAGKGIRYGK